MFSDINMSTQKINFQAYLLIFSVSPFFSYVTIQSFFFRLNRFLWASSERKPFPALSTNMTYPTPIGIRAIFRMNKHTTATRPDIVNQCQLNPNPVKNQNIDITNGTMPLFNVKMVLGFAVIIYLSQAKIYHSYPAKITKRKGLLLTIKRTGQAKTEKTVFACPEFFLIENHS